jgi:hypothetical protein
MENTEGLRNFHIGRDQILARLWYLANLSPEVTKGSMASQIKALSMIIAMEGLIPDRRTAAHPPLPQAQTSIAEPMRPRQTADAQSPQPETAFESQTASAPVPRLEPSATPTFDPGGSLRLPGKGAFARAR